VQVAATVVTVESKAEGITYLEFTQKYTDRTVLKINPARTGTGATPDNQRRHGRLAAMSSPSFRRAGDNPSRRQPPRREYP